jgi:pimeloyl-ACP methyl ester carboxylesterase
VVSTLVQSKNKLAGADQSSPLLIEEQGHFFVAGRYFTTSHGQFMAGQMYVEYQIPKNRTYPFPIVMWHGGSQSGACFTGTPDGRDGWAQFFLKQGYAVYVVDQPGRGRSAYNADAYGPLSLSAKNTARVQDRFTASERSKPWPQAHLHTQWPGSGMAGDASFDQLYAEQLPEIESFSRRQSLNRDAGVALLDRIGPSIILTHSQSGPFGWLIADAKPNFVKAIVAAEPNGPPVYDSEFHNDGTLARPWGLTSEPLTYSPVVSDPKQLSFVQQEQPDGPGLLRGWLQKEPARALINLKSIPIIIVTTEASYHAGYDHCTARYLTQAGVSNTHVRLAEQGIRGNGHMMMLEKNSLQIAAVIADWLEKNVIAQKAR